jgi:hypothetical protein
MSGPDRRAGAFVALAVSGGGAYGAVQRLLAL